MKFQSSVIIVIFYFVFRHFRSSLSRESWNGNERPRYKSIYGTSNFNTTPVENAVGTLEGVIDLLRRFKIYHQNVQPDETPVPNSSYDFIVVGAGTAGATVASRLSEIRDVNVLLIEAGGEETLIMDIPAVANFLQAPDEINWKYETEPSNEYCRGMHDHRCKWPRGKVMGGSSVLNYLIATRGNKWDYDRWAELGNNGWAYADVLKYFKKLENVSIPEFRQDTKNRGTDGPISIEYSIFRTPLLTAFLEAGQELGYPLVDYNGDNQIGFSAVQATMRNGYRVSSNRGYLTGKLRGNLHVTKLTMAQKILIDEKSKRAIGVEIVKAGRRFSVFAKKEVILSAGAIGSPQLLMLSGIGPAKHLQSLGINVMKDANVGDNLMDHIMFGGVVFTLQEPVSVDIAEVLDITKPYLKDYLLHANGPLAIPGVCEGVAFVDTEDPTNKNGLPDIELISLGGTAYSITALLDNFGYEGEIREKVKPLKHIPGWQVLPAILRPKSRGWMRLKSKDVNVKPKIIANYLSHPDDIKVLLRGIRTAYKIGQSKAFGKLGAQFYNKTMSECDSYQFDSDDYWLCFLRIETLTIYHYSGTCKMGPESDRTAVVDPTLKVIGIKGLRVADASIMPEIPSGHTNIPTCMIAEKLSDMIKTEWGYPNN